MPFLVFFASLILLLVCARILVSQTEKLSVSFKISPLVIGATVIALGTSLPELSVTISSLAQKVSGLSLGNIIGSSIGNAFFIGGVSILIFPVRIGTTKTQRNNIFNLIITLLFISAFFLPVGISRNLAIGLFAVYLVFLVVELVWGEEGGKKEDKKTISKLEKSNDNKIIIGAKAVLAVAGLVFASKYTVSSAVYIADFFKLKDEVIGLTLLSFGTTLPEFITSVAAGLKKDWKLMVGNLQGSGIFNLGVLGFLLIRYSTLPPLGDNFIPLAYLLLSALAIFILFRKYEGTVIPKYWGIIFLIIHASYLLLIFF